MELKNPIFFINLGPNPKMKMTRKMARHMSLITHLIILKLDLQMKRDSLQEIIKIISISKTKLLMKKSPSNKRKNLTDSVVSKDVN